MAHLKSLYSPLNCSLVGPFLREKTFKVNLKNSFKILKPLKIISRFDAVVKVVKTRSDSFSRFFYPDFSSSFISSSSSQQRRRRRRSNVMRIELTL